MGRGLFLFYHGLGAFGQELNGVGNHRGVGAFSRDFHHIPLASLKFEPAQFTVNMTYGDWEHIFCNDLVILGNAKRTIKASARAGFMVLYS